MLHGDLKRPHSMALTVLFVVSLLALALPPSAVQAQFVCGGSATGADPVTGAGATAAAGSLACGPGAESTGTRSIAIGVSDGLTNTTSSGIESVAIGSGAIAGGRDSIAIGRVTSAGNGDFNIAIGGFINPGHSSTTAVGNGSLVNGSNTTVLGDGAGTGNNTANNAVAIGQGSLAGADNATAVGQGSEANFTGSAAFGQGAKSTRADQQMFGTATNTYTMAGLTSDASKTAQGAPTALVTTNDNGDLAAYTTSQLGLASTGDIVSINSQINSLHQRDRELASGIAMTAALAQPILLADQSFGMRVGWGDFDGSNAVGVTGAGVIARGYAGPTSSMVLDAGVGFGTTDSMVTGRAGVTFGW